MALITHPHRSDKNPKVVALTRLVLRTVGSCLAIIICIPLIAISLIALPFLLLSGQEMKSGEYWD